MVNRGIYTESGFVAGISAAATTVVAPSIERRKAIGTKLCFPSPETLTRKSKYDFSSHKTLTGKSNFSPVFQKIAVKPSKIKK